MERERCTRWSGRLKPGCLETLRSTSLAEQEHPIKWLGVFDGPPPQGHIGAGYFVQIQTTQLSKNRMEYFMGKIFGDCFEDLEPMRSPHNAFCEREPAFSIGTRDRQGRRPLRTAPPESVVRPVVVTRRLVRLAPPQDEDDESDDDLPTGPLATRGGGNCVVIKHEELTYMLYRPRKIQVANCTPTDLEVIVHDDEICHEVLALDGNPSYSSGPGSRMQLRTSSLM